MIAPHQDGRAVLGWLSDLRHIDDAARVEGLFGRRSCYHLHPVVHDGALGSDKAWHKCCTQPPYHEEYATFWRWGYIHGSWIFIAW